MPIPLCLMAEAHRTNITASLNTQSSGENGGGIRFFSRIISNMVSTKAGAIKSSVGRESKRQAVQALHVQKNQVWLSSPSEYSERRPMIRARDIRTSNVLTTKPSGGL